jgi:flagellar basal body-associated protein FliL
MLNRSDRSIKSGLLLPVALVLLTAAAGAGLAFWWNMSAGPSAPPSPAETQALPLPVHSLRRDEPVVVTFYFPGENLLSTGTAAIKRQADTQAQAREALNALFIDQRTQQAALFRELKLREIYLDATGTAYVDLAVDQRKELRASTGEELLILYAIVNTLMQNFEEIKQVFFLIDGKEVRTLAGHADLSRKFTKRLDLVRQ